MALLTNAAVHALRLVQAEVEEEERVSKARAEIEARAEAARRVRKTPKPEKMPSKRPDRWAGRIVCLLVSSVCSSCAG